MEYNCEFCNKNFTTKSILKTHQTKAKSCLKIQEKEAETIYECSYCAKTFTLKSSCERHLNGHLNDPVNIKITEELNELKNIKNTLEEKEGSLKNALDQIEVLKEQLKISQESLKALQEANIKRIEEENKENKKKIERMTKKYVKKQQRVQFEVPNVIYIVTTELLKKERRYILGKASDLTDRLSTYNKTDEHEVVYYQGCGDEDSMSLVENVVFHKLKEYREQANRERFVLPEGVKVDVFIEAIKSGVEACKVK